MLWEPTRGLVLADRHRKRLLATARHLGQELDEEQLDGVLPELNRSPGTGPRRCRLTVTPSGEIAVEVADSELLPSPVTVAFAELDVSVDDPRLWHKTTAREIYARALASRPEADDVVLVNRDGEVTESTRANLVVYFDGQWLTPRREAGLLDGTLRAELLESGGIGEAKITPEMVRSAEAVYLINSVRGWMPARLFPQSS